MTEDTKIRMELHSIHKDLDFASMKKARFERSKSELQRDVASMYPNIPIKKEVTE